MLIHWRMANYTMSHTKSCDATKEQESVLITVGGCYQGTLVNGKGETQKGLYVLSTSPFVVLSQKKCV